MSSNTNKQKPPLKKSQKVVAIIGSAIILAFSGLIIYNIWTLNQQVEKNKTEIEVILEDYNRVVQELDKALNSNIESDEKIKQLESEKSSLEEQLQAKLNKQEAEKIATTQTVAAAQIPDGDCSTWMQMAGISDFGNAYNIFMRESGCNPLATNPSSGAYGICQSLPAGKMASAGDDWQSNPVTQMKWCESYMLSRYGTWANAWNFWQNNNWW